MIQAPLRGDLQPLAGARYRNASPWVALGAVALVAMSACGTEATVTVEPLFKEAFQGTNGRSCATCHVRKTASL